MPRWFLSALYDAVFFGVRPDAVSWLGAGKTLTGAAMLAWREGLG